MVTGEYISEIYKWYTEGSLQVNRRYQRKLVWTLAEKQHFIDTILNNYPVPLFLLVNAEQKGDGIKQSQKEIIDGLQRIEAIISFILNKFPVKINGVEQYFNLEVYPGNSILLKDGKLEQKSPVMDAEISHRFMLYQLPISTINANEMVVDDVFKRINSTGRKLSSQDLRQAGIQSKFSNLVRLIATHLRGDATDSDIVNMNEIADYSLSGEGLDYGLDIRTVFWVQQGILTEDALRRSKDEEIIAILCSCILSNFTAGMSRGALKSLYNSTSAVYKQNEELLTQGRIEEMIALFQRIISDLEKVFNFKNTNFAHLLFEQSKNYNKDLVFIVLFSAVAQLYSEHYQIDDYDTFGDALNNIADRDLNVIIGSAACEWNKDVRNHLVARVKNVLVEYMTFTEHDAQWNTQFISLIKQAAAESQMFDFKIGFHDLRNGEENKNVLPKCIKTLIAMANTKPYQEGVIVLGVSDKESDAKDCSSHYGTAVPKYNDYYVPGIQSEALKYYGSIQRFLEYIKTSVEKMDISKAAIHYILTTMDTLRYENQILVVLKLKTDKPLFYNKELFVRYDSFNKPIDAGSDQYYEVLNNFQEKSTSNLQSANMF